MHITQAYAALLTFLDPHVIYKLLGLPVTYISREGLYPPCLFDISGHPMTDTYREEGPLVDRYKQYCPFVDTYREHRPIILSDRRVGNLAL